jgi:hypothetical protein
VNADASLHPKNPTLFVSLSSQSLQNYGLLETGCDVGEAKGPTICQGEAAKILNLLEVLGFLAQPFI